ncbi:hypothetical protein BDW59DRAFT_161062 [Aspergillus cavernicola]|uniref:Uncharacterized protein n=1 Tax=Aspergillus cavernicola TaxID=176166 RepID=A0ABR4IES5_9EURO
MCPMRAVLLATASKYVSELNTFNSTSFSALHTPACVTHFITPTHRSSKSNEEFLELCRLSRSIFTTMLVVILDERRTIVDELTRKVMLHLKYVYWTTVDTHEAESITVLAMEDSCLLINAVFIFTDDLKHFIFEQGP